MNLAAIAAAEAELADLEIRFTVTLCVLALFLKLNEHVNQVCSWYD